MNYFGFAANLVDAFMLFIGKGGKILNAKKIRWCFVVDIFCLLYWFYMDLSRGLYSQGFSCIVSIMIAVYGFINWSRK